MGWYEERVVPKLVDWACGSKNMNRWREKATAGLHGDIVEIGFGSGRNVELYPAELHKVFAVEPSEKAMAMAKERVSTSHVLIERVGLVGEDLPLTDNSCDGALCTFTLCTVSDPAKVLSELKRVLKPGASLHFLEHGIAPDGSVAKWQQRLNGFEKKVAGGCHLTRDPLTLFKQAGCEVEVIRQRYAKGPKPWSYFTVGTARWPND
jgi:ubiquinone/menaquinone biosynthesis C-methylase UbiE